MSLLSQYAGQASSEHDYRRMMEMLTQQHIQSQQSQQYFAPLSLSSGLEPTEHSPVLLLLPRKAA